LAGLTQGSFWGDEQQNATNYGLVQITNLKTHHVSYARAFNYSSTSISRSANSTFDFEIDPKMENGPSQLRVIANGIASQPVDVTISGAFDKAAADKAAADKAAADKAAADKAAADKAAADKAAADKAAADKAAADKAAADKAAADKAAADKAAADKAAVKKLTITCVKGKLTKTVTAVKPACPVGYKRR
jgi:predicted DNA-binding transcriptional regulator YafY